MLLSVLLANAQTWTELGPFENPKTADGTITQGASVNNRIQVVATSSGSVIYTLTPAGLWKSTDGGANFTCITLNGCGLTVTPTSFYVNPRNINQIIATNAYPNNKLLIYISNDGGLNWTDNSLKDVNGNNLIGGTDYLSFALDISQPLNIHEVYFTTNSGVYHRDLNLASTTWQKVTDIGSNSMIDICFVQDATVSTKYYAYASGANVIYKRNLGVWQPMSQTGIANIGSNTLRTSVGKNGTLYTLAFLSSSGNAFLYKYNQTANAWTQVGSSMFNDTPVYFKILVSPANDNLVFLNTGISPYGHLNYNKNGTWYYNDQYDMKDCANFHGDIRDFAFDPNNSNKLYCGTDGFVAKFNSLPSNCTKNTGCESWGAMPCVGLGGSMWGGGISTSPDDPNIILINLWHNNYSTASYSSPSGWKMLNNNLTGELGIISISSSDNNNTIYLNEPYDKSEGLSIKAYNNSSLNIIDATLIPYSGGASDIIAIYRDQINNKITYEVTDKNIVKFYNIQLSSNTLINTTPTSIFGPTILSNEKIVAFGISSSDNNIMYVITSEKKIYSSSLNSSGILVWNAGFSLPTDGVSFPIESDKHLAVSFKDPNKVYYVGRYTSSPHLGAKAFMSNDRGQTWTNISNGLPNDITPDPSGIVASPTFLASEKGTNDALYVGTTLGVYYRDDANTTWSKYGTGVGHLSFFAGSYSLYDINYKSNKLSTHGCLARQIGLKCPAQPALNVISVANNGWYEAKSTLTCSIATGATNKYWFRSGGEITLGDGFSANLGTEAAMFIHGCDGITSPSYSFRTESDSESSEQNKVDSTIAKISPVVQNALEVYPNPTSGPFKIKLNLAEDVALKSLTIRDAQGKVLKTFDKFSLGEELEVNEMFATASNFVMVELITNKKRYSSKLIYLITGDPRPKEGAQK